MLRFHFLAVLSLASLYAQIGTDNAIVGLVTDPTQAAVVDASITAINLGTGLTRVTKTSESGAFEIVALPRGLYSVQVEAPRFKAWQIKPVELGVGQRVRLTPVLEIGEVVQRVDVTASVEILQTEKGSIETSVEEKSIRELPVNGRNPVSLVALTPGMNISSLGAGRHRSSSVQGVGARSDETEFQVDGLTSMETVGKTAVALPSIETVAEFTVQTNSFTAEQGNNPLQVLMVTRSGTNQFHGSLWNFLRNDALDARNTFAATKPVLRRNQFGAVLGGPIIKDKTHFFVSYEGTRIRQQSVYNLVTFSPGMLQGDFSSLPRTIRDPLTGEPFPGNQIPANRISSASSFFTPYLPAPNAPDNRFASVASAPDDSGIYSLRLDHQFSSSHRLYGRFGANRFAQSTPQSPPSVTVSFDVLQLNAGLGYTWSITPNTLLTVNGGYVRTRALIGTTAGGIENLVEKAGIQGFSSPFSSCCYGLPSVTIAGYSGIPGNAVEAPGRQIFWTQNYKANIAHIRGTHSIGAGYTFFNSAFISAASDCCTRGVFTFGSQYTGDGFADYLLGLPSSTQRSFPTSTFGVHDSPYSALYFQDFWKATPSLTLNFGVRYDYWHEKAFVRGVGSTFDLSRGVAVTGEDKSGQVDLVSQPISQFFGPATKDLWITASQAGLPPGLFIARGYLSPRLGFAWRPGRANGFVVRGGYGIFGSLYNDNSNGSSIVSPPFLVNESQTFSATQLQRWESIWDNNPRNFVAPSNYSPLPDLPTIKMHQWNVSIQKSLPFESALTLSYVGNRVVDQVTLLHYNIARPGQHANLQADLPYPAFGVIMLYDQYGFSNYNGLHAKFERRFTNGLSVQAVYAFAKHLGEGEGSLGDTPEPYSPEGYNRGRSQLDRTHILSINSVWEIPVGRNRRALSNLPRAADLILGGWQVTGIYRFTSGTPLTFTVPGATLGNGRNSRPNLVGDLRVDNPSAARWFNPAALAAPPLYQFGNSGLAILDGPGVHLLDTGLMKNFYFSESRFLQFRWEMFNAPNHVNLGNPNTTINQAATGQILSAGAARSMQFALKLSF